MTILTQTMAQTGATNDSGADVPDAQNLRGKTAEGTLRRPQDLADAGLAAPGALPELEAVAARYAIAITPTIARLIDPTDPDDPIARQFVPDARELDHKPEERADPIGDEAHSPVPGIVHRYPDRVLLKLVSVCPLYCRFCFRREMVGPGGSEALSGETLDRALAYVAQNDDIWEVIVTGGDPFALSPRRIGEITRRIAAIEHVRMIRWHTRVPIGDPGRVTEDFVAALQHQDLTTTVVVHANHPRELGAEAQTAIARMIEAGIPILSQSVLLKGVNDNADTLVALLRRLAELRVKPYYLHHADLAPGTSHFRNSIAQGQALMTALRGQLSGFALPTYVLDIPGGHGKVPIGPAYVTASEATKAAGVDGSEALVRDPDGNLHIYPPRTESPPRKE